MRVRCALPIESPSQELEGGDPECESCLTRERVLQSHVRERRLEVRSCYGVAAFIFSAHRAFVRAASVVGDRLCGRHFWLSRADCGHQVAHDSMVEVLGSNGTSPAPLRPSPKGIAVWIAPRGCPWPAPVPGTHRRRSRRGHTAHGAAVGQRERLPAVATPSTLNAAAEDSQGSAGLGRRKARRKVL